MIDVDIQLASEHAPIPSDEQLILWAQTALADFKQDAELSIRLVDNEESQQLNSEYRGKDKPTNVLSFPFEIPPELADIEEIGHLIGDLVICVPVVAAEAHLQNKTFSDHFAHMVTHGCLHLLGYDHIKDEDAEIMENLERQILARLEIADPYLITD
ncbi:rRNA maturation RNase YbeY [Bermanella sp. WJH001]|uniref:rRNA maturation RNase YbeY n=1 Tax=Bermanella sp. WJH001 TaxID=3048005 RepID=UPI0024BED302|nr:rRNA maturation RNase YbeY [Bermanella sp. WJH001]MDJ1538462.1 rRNA maturation RNase YbeY [Bermanella sp. WJH001]